MLNALFYQVYLEGTQQWFPFRRYQHEYAVKNQSSTNGIAQHVAKTNHEIDWENMKFLDSEPHWRKRKIKEALFIDCLNPQKQISDAIYNEPGKRTRYSRLLERIQCRYSENFLLKVPAKK